MNVCEMANASDVMVARTLCAPVSLAQLGETRRSGTSLLAEEGVRWRESHLSRSGLRLWCRFEASEAGAVRTALRRLGEPVDGLWSGTFVRGGDEGRPSVVVEGRLPTNAPRVLEAGGAGCCALECVRCTASFATSVGGRAFWLYETPDAELVRIALRRAGLVPDGVWPLAGVVRMQRNLV
jgi:hypothetical protein